MQFGTQRTRSSRRRLRKTSLRVLPAPLRPLCSNLATGPTNRLVTGLIFSDARDFQELRTARRRKKVVRRLAGGERVRGPAEAGPAVVYDRHSAAERDRRPDDGARVEQYAAGYFGPARALGGQI